MCLMCILSTVNHHQATWPSCAAVPVVYETHCVLVLRNYTVTKFIYIGLACITHGGIYFSSYKPSLITDDKQTIYSVVTLNRRGRARRSLTLIDSPISVAILQWGIVGVKWTMTQLSLSLTSICCS